MPVGEPGLAAGVAGLAARGSVGFGGGTVTPSAPASSTRSRSLGPMTRPGAAGAAGAPGAAAALAAISASGVRLRLARLRGFHFHWRVRDGLDVRGGRLDVLDGLDVATSTEPSASTGSTSSGAS